MQRKLNKIAKDTNLFLRRFIAKQKKSNLIVAMKYGLFSGGKKIRSKILIDVGFLFKLDYKTLIVIGAAVECIHAYSLIHDDLPCMDNDNLRRGKLSTHKKFGESTAILAGNSLLTIAFEILSDKNFKIDNNSKINLINSISKCSGHAGIAGGQYLDLSFEKKKVSIQKIKIMEVKKTGKLFSFCCMAPIIVSDKLKHIKKFELIGEQIGLLFQIVDDLIDFKGKTKHAGKKTKKDIKKGKATIISLLGYKNAVKYANKLNTENLSALRSGNISVRYKNGFLITPSGVKYSQLETEDVVFVSLDGKFESLKQKPSSEWRIHKDIYVNKKEANAVVHAHSTHATAVSAHGKSIPAFHYMVALAGGDDIKCAEYATFGTEELSKNILEALNKRKACLMSNHGQVVFDTNLEKAFELAEEIENICQQYINALKIGQPKILSDDEMIKILEQIKNYKKE